jgi:hypothetical protein
MPGDICGIDTAMTFSGERFALLDKLGLELSNKLFIFRLTERYTFRTSHLKRAQIFPAPRKPEISRVPPSTRPHSLKIQGVFFGGKSQKSWDSQKPKVFIRGYRNSNRFLQGSGFSKLRPN